MTSRAPAWLHAANVIVLVGGAAVARSSTGSAPTVAWFEAHPLAAFGVMAGTASVSSGRTQLAPMQASSHGVSNAPKPTRFASSTDNEIVAAPTTMKRVRRQRPRPTPKRFAA